jgi:hypothetical protein
VSTVYLAPQKLADNRFCGVSAGMGNVTALATPITTDDNGG